MNKSYAETIQGPKDRYIYDWPNIIHNIRHGLFTEREAKEWKNAAYDWVTCACGNQCTAIERNIKGEPSDFNLSTFGEYFCQSIRQAFLSREVAEKHCNAALLILAKIETRATEVLREQGMKREGAGKED